MRSRTSRRSRLRRASTAQDLEVAIARDLLDRVKASGVSLAGPGGLLASVTAGCCRRRCRDSARPSRSGNGLGPKPSDVRAWAKSEGIEVKDKGRVPAELIVKFQAAGS